MVDMALGAVGCRLGGNFAGGSCVMPGHGSSSGMVKGLGEVANASGPSLPSPVEAGRRSESLSSSLTRVGQGREAAATSVDQGAVRGEAESRFNKEFARDASEYATSLSRRYAALESKVDHLARQQLQDFAQTLYATHRGLNADPPKEVRKAFEALLLKTEERIKTPSDRMGLQDGITADDFECANAELLIWLGSDYTKVLDAHLEKVDEDACAMVNRDGGNLAKRGLQYTKSAWALSDAHFSRELRNLKSETKVHVERHRDRLPDLGTKCFAKLLRVSGTLEDFVREIKFGKGDKPNDESRSLKDVPSDNDARSPVHDHMPEFPRIPGQDGRQPPSIYNGGNTISVQPNINVCIPGMEDFSTMIRAFIAALLENRGGLAMSTVTQADNQPVSTKRQEVPGSVVEPQVDNLQESGNRVPDPPLWPQAADQQGGADIPGFGTGSGTQSEEFLSGLNSEVLKNARANLKEVDANSRPGAQSGSAVGHDSPQASVAEHGTSQDPVASDARSPDSTDEVTRRRWSVELPPRAALTGGAVTADGKRLLDQYYGPTTTPSSN